MNQTLVNSNRNNYGLWIDHEGGKIQTNQQSQTSEMKTATVKAKPSGMEEQIIWTWKKLGECDATVDSE